MVRYEGKPVQALPRPPVLDPNAEVWFMEETGEIFVEYESYLKRRDFYKQKRFTCDVTGQSGLTFFEAVHSETEGSRSIDSPFPPPLREPVLRQVQFSTIPRLTELVTTIFNVFKCNFFPGESIIVILPNRPKTEGVVRETAKFPEIRTDDGTVVRKAFSRYFVKVGDTDGQEALLDEDHITRDRRLFSKQMLQAFLKATITREPWAGAPWLVKEHIAKQYKIETKIPERLLHSSILEQRKSNLAFRNNFNQGTLINFRPTSQGSDVKSLGKLSKGSMTPHEWAIRKQTQQIHYQQAMMNGHHPSFAVTPGVQPFPAPPVDNIYQFRNGVKDDHKPVRPPPVKYPIEDLDVPPRHGQTKRPQLKLFSDDRSGLNVSSDRAKDVISMDSVGPLLEVWNTLNVLCEVYLLDSFTLDDFADAMRFSHPEIQCELFQEVHCSVLKLLVNESGHVQVALPETPKEDEEEEGSTDDSTITTSLEKPEMDLSNRVTRSNATISETVNHKAASRQSTPDAVPHRAAELVAKREWMDRLKARDFKDGGWQVIVVGLLYQLSLLPRQRSVCDRILADLAPTDQKPTQETVRLQYLKLDVNLRIAALHIITLLSVQTKAVRNLLEECSEAMTVHRKEKIEWQRKKKHQMDELRELDEQRKLLLPDNNQASPESPGIADAPVTPRSGRLEERGKRVTRSEGGTFTPEIGTPGEEEGSVKVSEEEEDNESRSTRRSSGRRLDLKRKREEENAKKEKEKEQKKIKLERENSTKQQAMAFKKLLKEIQAKNEEIKECDAHIAELEEDLREANCQRTKILGRDRFWNRYMWFERNGMPFGGLKSSSTHHYGYANGRLWIQGPEEMERKGFIDRPEEEQAEYKSKFGVSILERKEAEEGSTRLSDAHQWGLLDDPTDLDALIGWLDDRGKRERDLKKELLYWKDHIAKYMKVMKAHLAQMEERKAGSEEQATRVSTRTKTYIDATTTKHRCLVWRNNAAVRSIGHRHYEQPRPKVKNAKRGAVSGDAAEQKGVARVLTGKTGKPLTRQGTRYGKL